MASNILGKRKQPRSAMAPTGGEISYPDLTSAMGVYDHAQTKQPSPLEREQQSFQQPTQGQQRYQQPTATDPEQDRSWADIRKEADEAENLGRQESEIYRIIEIEPYEWTTILEVPFPKSEEDLKGLQQEVKQSYKELIKLVHPDKAKDNVNATKVFQMVQDAYVGLTGDTSAFQNIKGREEGESRSLDLAKPEQFHLDLYQTASQYIDQLRAFALRDPSGLSEPASLDPIYQRLEGINEEIRKANRVHGLQSDVCLIEYMTHAKHFELKNIYELLLNHDAKTPQHKLVQVLASRNLPILEAVLEDFNRAHGYPASWSLKPGGTAGSGSATTGAGGTRVWQFPGMPEAPPGNGRRWEDLPLSREGYPILAGRRAGRNGHRGLVFNGKTGPNEIPIEFQAGSQIGFDLIGRVFPENNRSSWDWMEWKKGVSRETEAVHYRRIIVVIRSKNSSSKQPETQIWAVFENDMVGEYSHILNQAHFEKVLGQRAARADINNYFKNKNLIEGSAITPTDTVALGGTTKLGTINGVGSDSVAPPASTRLLDVATANQPETQVIHEIVKMFREDQERQRKESEARFEAMLGRFGQMNTSRVAVMA